MKKVMENVEFWKTCILFYRNRTPKTLKDKVENARALNDARGWLKYAEGKILVLVLLAILCCAGCGKMLGGAGQMLDGFGDGASYVGQHLQEAVNEK